MPYYISDTQADCSGWATVKEESDGRYTTIGCHDTKQDAIDQMVAASISEGLEPGGERALPENYRPALAEDVPEGRACGNCFFYNEAKLSEDGTKAWCEHWSDFVDGGYYCNTWRSDEEARAVDLSAPSYMRENADLGLKYLRDGFGGDGLTDGTKREAREMSDGNISEDKVRRMAPWFARHKINGDAPQNSDPSDSGYPGPGLVAWLLWGGDSNFGNRAQDWAQRKIDALDAESDNTPRSKMKKIERRTYVVRDIEAREADGSMRLAGYAAVFNESSVPLPFHEVIAPGAFRKTLTETPDVRLLINHEGLPLARTKNGTLTLSEDERGLFFDAELADTTEARDLWTLVQRGDVDQMSFAFRVIRQKWSEDRKNRTLTEVSLADGDVSVVTYPAYPTTKVEARELLSAALRAKTEGRDMSPEAMLLLEGVLTDLTMGHDAVMRATEMLAEFIANDTAGYHDEDDEDMRAVDTVGDFVSWESSGGTARGRIERVVRDGVLQIPDSEFTVEAMEDDPAVLIRVYRELRDGYLPTDTLVGHKASTLTSIEPLAAPSEDASRSISLRLAKAIANQIS